MHETRAAMDAIHAGHHATDPQVRGIMARIGQDESRHAALAREISQWLRPQLSSQSHRYIAGAQRSAVRKLELNARRTQPTDLTTTAGLPRPATSRAMLVGLRATPLFG